MTDFRWRSRLLVERPRRRGVSIVEIFTGLVILGLVAGLVGPRVFGYHSPTRVAAAHEEMKSLASALDLFRLDIGRYPTNDEGLDALVRKPTDLDRWAGPYLKPPVLPKDPWGDAYTYSVKTDAGPYTISSPGIDAERANNQ